MKTYKVRPHVWNISWNSHEIRFEYLTKPIGPNQEKAIIFFDGKRVPTKYKNNDKITATTKTEGGIEYTICCGVYSKDFYQFHYFWEKSIWERIKDYIDVVLSTFELYASFMINGDLIYLSNVGYKDAIEWEKLQYSLKVLKKEQEALSQGYALIRNVQKGYGVCKKKISGDDLKKTKICLENQKKELEYKLNDWKHKWEKD